MKVDSDRMNQQSKVPMSEIKRKIFGATRTASYKSDTITSVVIASPLGTSKEISLPRFQATPPKWVPDYLEVPTDRTIEA